MELDVLSHETDGHMCARRFDARYHRLPLCKVRRGRIRKPQLPADNAGKALPLQHQRRFIEHRQRPVFDDAVGGDVAEHGDLFQKTVLQRLVAAQHDDVRMDAHALQLLDGVLRGFRFMLAAAMEIGHQRDVDKKRVAASLLQPHLADRLQKGLALDVAGGAADLRDDHVGAGLFSHGVDEILDGVGDVGDHLHGLAQILPATLGVQHVPVDLAGGEVGELVQILVDEALIVAEIQVGLRPVLGDVDLAVLVGAHGAGVHIDIGIQLLRRHLQPPRLQKPAQRRRSDALAEPGDHAARDENVFAHLADLHENKVWTKNKKERQRARSLAARRHCLSTRTVYAVF